VLLLALGRRERGHVRYTLGLFVETLRRALMEDLGCSEEKACEGRHGTFASEVAQTEVTRRQW
jgi:hypothetical protein